MKLSADDQQILRRLNRVGTSRYSIRRGEQMIKVENHEFNKEINKLHQTILNVDSEYERAKSVAYADLARYLKMYAPKDFASWISAPQKQAL